MKEVTANYDESWKEALNEYFESFLIFFFPEVHQLIDWTQTPRSLDKELQEITASSATEKRIADKLYQVWLLDKRVIWILIHIEIQSQYEVDFGERMYVYNYRSFDLYHKPVVSLAVLGDESSKWRPNTYSYAIGGCEVSLKFPIAKLLDYESRWQELETNTNPFAIIVMAHLKTKATTGNLSEREQWKWTLVRGLYERGLNKEQIVKLFKIIDMMMTLPEQLQQKLVKKINSFEEERKMPFISPTEQMAIERGKEIGKEIGALQNARNYITTVLQARLGEVSSEITASLALISNLSILDEMLKLSITVNSLDDFKQALESATLT
ncbi:hypothetical protein [Dolichospermum sp. UHCC 0406]|uniref:hypothetical protein n=1 Tax=Dolichospermum sp. UHCC 0406 TaxID=2590017 RepID=UPI001446F828|nr:hypothetical protein [Dolichospermum sp. UHCC 0406]MTJ38825.1 hypothetical protein [Dolichospermum sp. UHCC 0406]